MTKHGTERERERERVMTLSSSHHLTGAHTLKDFCPAKTNGDSLNPRRLRPKGAIKNQALSPDQQSVTHILTGQPERGEGAVVKFKKVRTPKTVSCWGHIVLISFVRVHLWGNIFITESLQVHCST